MSRRWKRTPAWQPRTPSLSCGNISLVTREETAAAVRAVLAGESTLVLATADRDGAVSCASLFYIFDDQLSLYWLSSPDSRHSRNLVDRPQASIAVHPSVQGWREIRGVQMDGVAAVVVDPVERGRVIADYVARFLLGSEMSGAIDQSTLYRFQPSWVRYLDNSRGFGFHAETFL